jgi:hypothetical protein
VPATGVSAFMASVPCHATRQAVVLVSPEDEALLEV